MPAVTSLADVGPLAFTLEAWVKQYSIGYNHPGFGFANDIFNFHHEGGADVLHSGFGIANGTDIFCNVGTFDYPGFQNNYYDLFNVPGVVSVGPVYHIVYVYDGSGNFGGDGNMINQTGGKHDVYVNGVHVFGPRDSACGRAQFFNHIGDVTMRALIGKSGSGVNNWSATAWIDEVAAYPYALTPTQIAHHYAVGTGATGGIGSTSAQLFVRNDSNTAWIALNMAALRQEMPERREFKVRAVYPDGRYEDLLGRWGTDTPQTFGTRAHAAWQKAKSGLYIPRSPSRKLVQA
jgi:Concanavalin A-like lectin/glucanases superfamily